MSETQGHPAFGVHTLFTLMPDPADWDVLAASAREAGFSWVREGVHWGHIETAPDVWDWERTDQIMAVLKRHELSVLSPLGGPPPWKSVAGEGEPYNSMPKMEAFTAWVDRVLDRYGDVVAAWEAFNEPNWKNFWRPEPNTANYAAFLEAMHKQIRGSGHKGDIVAMSVAYCDLEFIEDVFRHGGNKYSEVVSVHPYSLWGSPERSATKEGIQAVADLMTRWELEPRIWVTEIGWSPWPTGLFAVGSEQTASDYQVRSHALCLSVPGTEKIFVHSLRDDLRERPPNQPEDVEFIHRFGLFTDDLKPRLMYDAMKVTTSELRGQAFERELPVPPGCHAYVFEGSGRRTAVCWTTEGEMQIQVPGAATVVDRSGAQRPAGDDGITLTESPVFVRLD